MDLQEALDARPGQTEVPARPVPASLPENVQDLEQALVAPRSWQILNQNGRASDQTSISALTNSIVSIRSWLQRWPSAGSLPFMHPQIYRRDGMPPCLQDAYAASATYFASTNPTTKPLVWPIVDRSVKSLTTTTTQSPSSSSSSSSIPSGPCCLTLHLARVQALLIYQTIRLYDGENIRARGAAERDTVLLTRWAREMLECAWQSSRFVQASMPDGRGRIAGAGADDAATAAADDWKAWCLAESVRRTWVVVSVVQTAYWVIKGEENQSCPGHLLFTAGEGLWDAESWLAWLKAQRREGGEAALGCDDMGEDGGGLFARARQGRLDEFGRWALRVAAGREGVKSRLGGCNVKTCQCWPPDES